MEDSFLDYAVLGIGINVYPPESGFPEEIRNIAGAALEKRIPDGRNRLAAKFLERFFYYYNSEKLAGGTAPGSAGIDNSYAAEYRRRCFCLGLEIDVLSAAGKRKARALDVDGDCHLIVEYPDGTREALFSGEISVRMA